jgi:hypothetical protein
LERIMPNEIIKHSNAAGVLTAQSEIDQAADLIEAAFEAAVTPLTRNFGKLIATSERTGKALEDQIGLIGSLTSLFGETVKTQTEILDRLGRIEERLAQLASQS